MTTTRGTTLLAMGVALALGASIMGAGPAAWARTSFPDSATSETVRESLAAAGGLLAEPSDSGSPVGVTPVPGGTVSVPEAPSAGISLRPAEGPGIQVGIPESGEPQRAVSVREGTVTYLGENASSTVVVASSGVQIVTTIPDKDAPTRYDYALDLAPGQSLTIDDQGLPVVVDNDGEIVLAVLAPWAQDAHGNEIPTRYEVSGESITQVVDHTASADVAYPVVADPFFIPFWVLKCLAGIGIKGPQISAIMSSGMPWAIIAGLGRGALACFGV